MEGDIINLIKVWLSVFVCLSYCHAISKLVSRGPTRLLCVLPVVCIFLFLPLNLNSVQLRGTIAFFLVWLANFKLILFAFGKGPLCSDSSISLGRFVAVACTPIKIQQSMPPKPLEKPRNNQYRTQVSPPKSQLNGQSKGKPPSKPQEKPKSTHSSPPISHPNGKNKPKPSSKKSNESHIFLLKYAVMGLLMAILIRVYNYSDHIHPNMILLLYCIHLYFQLEIILVMVATVARALLGVELEPHFHEPYLTTSLQDFWGRRWNLMVTNILRLTVYEPTRHAAEPVIGRKWSQLPAVLATFLVSGLMHELMIYYMGCERPTLEITGFFLLQGFCLTLELVLKKAIFTGRSWLPRLISGPLTLGFVLVTSVWLFVPQFTRCKIDEKGLEEYALLGEFVKNTTRTLAYQISESFKLLG